MIRTGTSILRKALAAGLSSCLEACFANDKFSHNSRSLSTCNIWKMATPIASCRLPSSSYPALTPSVGVSQPMVGLHQGFQVAEHQAMSFCLTKTPFFEYPSNFSIHSRSHYSIPDSYRPNLAHTPSPAPQQTHPSRAFASGADLGQSPPCADPPSPTKPQQRRKKKAPLAAHASSGPILETENLPASDHVPAMSPAAPKPRRVRKKKTKEAAPGGECTAAYREARQEEEAGSRGEWGRVGSIHLVMGPMFAGKTTELLRRVTWEQAQGRVVELVKSSTDNRYDTSAVVSHDGARVPCTAVPDMKTFQERLGAERYAQVDVIGVDEAQFIRGLAEWCQLAADEHHKTIIVAGLDGDFRRQRFGELVEMLPVADSVTKLSACCGIEGCSQRAHFTFRKSMDTATEVVGGAELYMPVCRAHYWDRVRTLQALAAMEAQFQRQEEEEEEDWEWEGPEQEEDEKVEQGPVKALL